MPYNEIDLAAPNNGQGDGARVGGSKINENFKELFSRSFLRDQWVVSRWVYDPADLGFNVWRDGDMLEGWADPVEKTRWVRGIVLTATALSLPTDLDDAEKFLLLIDKQIVS